MELKNFKRQTLFIHFDAADPAGVLFFGSYFKIAHRLIEKSIIEAQIEWKEWFSSPHWVIPIRSAKADYFYPIFPGKNYEAQVFLVRLKRSSLEFEIHLFDVEKICTKISLLFVFVSKKQKKVISLPEKLKEKIKPYLTLPQN